ncbi:serine hydrolase [Steroidobacter sp.]|uniref:serine hydrolase n=1 Tax=Steroidobacter sp. TaxID=1978227 RepID=UPI001A41F16B|nr:serine hydrolase [Steroidobacter sp.]MBL8268641.1 serine hydrolase [Steroidobacter sp.]
MSVKMSVKMTSCLALWCVVVLSAFAAQASEPRSVAPVLRKDIEQARAEWNNVGVAVAVVKGDTVILTQGFGLKQAGEPSPVDAATLFQIGSTSKAFTGAALGILVDDGKIGWDDRVIDHLPGFRLADPWLTQHLTIRDTVTHRSGIAETPYYVFGVMTPDEAVGQLRYVEPEARFRDSFRYSNLMYGVAGQLIAAASGMSWNDFVQRRLLQPLNMTRSGTSGSQFWDAQYVTATFQGTAKAPRRLWSDARDGNVAMPHVLDEKGQATVLAWQSYDNAAAAGSIVSNATDMANWLRLNLNEGRFGGRQIVSRETQRELHATQNLHVDPARDWFPLTGSVEGYAMGWFRSRYRDHLHVAHSGGIIGFPAYVALLPEQKIGVAVLSNSPNRSGDTQAFNKVIAFGVLDRMLGSPSNHWSQQFLKRAKLAQSTARQKEDELQRARLPDAPPSLQLDQYVGDYEDRRHHSGPVSIRLQNGQLSLKFSGEGAFAGTLEPWHHDVFRLSARGSPWGFASFTLDPAGKASTLSAFGSTFERLATPVRP